MIKSILSQGRNFVCGKVISMHFKLKMVIAVKDPQLNRYNFFLFIATVNPISVQYFYINNEFQTLIKNYGLYSKCSRFTGIRMEKLTQHSK